VRSVTSVSPAVGRAIPEIDFSVFLCLRHFAFYVFSILCLTVFCRCQRLNLIVDQAPTASACARTGKTGSGRERRYHGHAGPGQRRCGGGRGTKTNYTDINQANSSNLITHGSSSMQTHSRLHYLFSRVEGGLQ
jgi:hypothetical protein